MKPLSKYRSSIVNLLAALAVSLLVNFSYYIAFIGINSTSMQIRRSPIANLDNPVLFLVVQTAFYFLLAFILFTIATARTKNNKTGFAKKLILCLAISVGLYFAAPISNRHGDTMLLFAHGLRIFNPIIVLKISFIFIVALLYGIIYDLLYQKQHVVLENELLKNENLETKYNMLVSQINPHFLFNSLNSLSMLVREKLNDKALDYIDRLSDTFRYILQNGQQGLTTLDEELTFLDAFKYLHEVRYAGKLFFDIEVDPSLRDWRLPSLTLQPLIENAVKHNSITRSKPFRIAIRTEGGSLVVSNPMLPKIGDTQGTGIGLMNISSRYQLLTGQDIVIQRDPHAFTVKLPLIPPAP